MKFKKNKILFYIVCVVLSGSLLVLGFFIFQLNHLNNLKSHLKTYTYTDENYTVTFDYPEQFIPPNGNYYATSHIIQNQFENNLEVESYFGAVNFQDKRDEGYCDFGEIEFLKIRRDLDNSDSYLSAGFTDQDQCQSYGLSIKYNENTTQDLIEQFKLTIESFSVEKSNASLGNVNTNQNENEETDKAPNADYLIDSYSCFNFINNSKFTDPSNTVPILDIEPLENLAKDWSWGKVCESLDSRQVFIVSVNRTITNEDEKLALFEKTKEIYPGLEKIGSPNSDYEHYQIYLLVNRTLDITIDSREKRFEPGILYPVTDFAYSGSLAGCYIEPGNFVSDGLTLSCGYGDNGCATIERVKWDLLTGEFQYLNSCYNNCDLAEDEPSTLTCQ